MTPRLSPAQRKAVTGSDPATGRLKAGVRVCTALVAAGLAVPHGRGGHHSVYLTREGLLLRAELARADADAAAGGQPPADTAADTAADGAESAGTFTADDGTGAASAPRDPARRAADVASAWEGLLQIRSLLGSGTTALPAPWERDRPVHAVALALEAAGCPPARPPAPTIPGAPDIPGVPDSLDASDGPDAPDRSGGPGAPGGPARGGPPRSPHGSAAANAAPSHAAGPTAAASPGGTGAAGRPGYRVSASTHPGLVEVSWSGPRSGDALAKCAALLPALGWQATTHRTRSGTPYLLVSPAGRTR